MLRYLLGVSAASRLALAASISPGSVGMGSPWERYPQWEEIFENANATGEYSFVGYDVSKNYNDSATQLSDWTATVSVAQWNDSEVSDHPIVAVDYTIRPPPSLDVGPLLRDTDENGTFPNDWKLCFNIASAISLKFDPPDDDEGDASCERYLSEDCYEALRAAAASGDDCSPINIPDACDTSDEEKEFGEVPLGSGTQMSSGLGVKLLNETAGYYIYGSSDDSDEFDYMEAYKDAVSRVWFIALSFGAPGDVNEPTAALMCLRAKDIAEGSESAGMKLMSPSMIGVTFASMSLIFHMLL